MVGAAVVGVVVGPAVVGVVVSAAFVVVAERPIVVYTVESTLNQKHVGRPTRGSVTRGSVVKGFPVASSTIFFQSAVQPLKISSSAKKKDE